MQIKCVYGLPENLASVDLKNCRLFVIEDAPEAFFSSIENGALYFLGRENEEEVLKQIAWDAVFLPFEFHDAPGNASKSLTRMKEIFQKLSYIQLGVHLTASDYQGNGLDILKNVLGHSQPAKRGKELFGVFKGIPAVICGGGPSLEHDGAYLRELKNKALIFSGGAGLNTLSELGIKPHFAAGIDPNPSTMRFFAQTAFETNFFYQGRFNADQLAQWQGERLWIEGSGSLPIEEWLFSSRIFDGGWNVSTFLTAIAYELGCNPIILCGVDLASKTKKIYASKVAEKQNEDQLEFRDENGTIFYSKRDWLMAAEWLGQFAESHPEREWINCSDGLKFRGFASKNLKDLSFSAFFDLDGFVHVNVQKVSNLDLDQEKKSLLKQSFNKSSELCSKLLQAIEKYFPESPEAKGEYIILESDLEDEIAYQKFLLPVWDVWKHIFQREIEPNVPKDYALNIHRLLFMMRVCDEAKQISN